MEENLQDYEQGIVSGGSKEVSLPGGTDYFKI